MSDANRLPNRRNVLTWGAAGLVGAGLAGLTGGRVASASASLSGRAPATLSFQSWDDTHTINLELAWPRKHHRNIKVHVLAVPGDYETKMDTEFAAGKAPDVFLAPDQDTLKWGASGQILDQLPYLKKMGIDPAASLLPSAQFWAGGKVGSKYWGTAVAVENIFMTYNKKLFKGGVPEPPSSVSQAWSWDTLIQNATKLTADSNGKNPGESGFDPKRIQRYGVFIDPTYQYYMLPLIYSNGGAVFNKSGKKFTMHEKPAAEAVQAVCDLNTKHHVAPTTTQQASSGSNLTLASGRIAMQIDGNWDIYGLQYPTKTFPLGIGVLPKLKEYKTVIEGAPLVISSRTKYPRQAVQLTSAIAQHSSPLWQSGIWEPVTETELYHTSSWYQSSVHPPNFKEVAVDTLKYAVPTPVHSVQAYGQIWTNLVIPAIQKAATGDVTAAQALKEIKAQADALLEG